MKTCAFTGHRQIKEEHKNALPALLSRAVEYAYGKGCRTFLAGGAIGFDTFAARAVISARMTHPDIRLILILPCINQSEHWSDAQRDRYEYTLSVADEVVYITDEYTKGCMKERNSRLANDCDLLIAYVERGNSGSGQTVRMASSLGKEVYNLYPALEKEICG